ncbi:hypothetical protein NEOLEDRAFT_1129865 [Neolentinus lepideus HHB14362 ss-1]|uniref:Uncharacterized protein n=1 Tax=Neolentinus lepideus HHB14362 ss-1 TaxID=1314782 RepID=A0A165UD07_9AGAM|nr:hypothetical protein NEOLEDRAFT_1129865 [Neolentinus lepideus HHB14362 ss-1]
MECSTRSKSGLGFETAFVRTRCNSGESTISEDDETLSLSHSSDIVEPSLFPPALFPAAASSDVAAPLDPSVEVAPGVRADGRWTSNHPLVQRWIRKVGKAGHCGLNGIVPHLLEIAHPPEDTRVWALAALEVELHPEHPSHWVLWNKSIMQKTNATIWREIYVKPSGAREDEVASAKDARIHSHHTASWFHTRYFTREKLQRVRGPYVKLVPREWWEEPEIASEEPTTLKRKRGAVKEQKSRSGVKRTDDGTSHKAKRARTTTAMTDKLEPRITRSGKRSAAVAAAAAEVSQVEDAAAQEEALVSRPSDETVAASRSNTAVSTADTEATTIAEEVATPPKDVDEEFETPAVDKESVPGKCATPDPTLEVAEVKGKAKGRGKVKTRVRAANPDPASASEQPKAEKKRSRSKKALSAVKTEDIAVPPAPAVVREQRAPPPSPQLVIEKGAERTKRKSQKAIEAAEAAARAPRRSVRNSKKADVPASK